jgi:hypothetical protein
MAEIGEGRRQRRLDLVDEVENLNEEVKTLALNLAVHLAKVRAGSQADDVVRLEPQFIRLVNGAVRAVQDLAVILAAARNRETMVYEPPSGEQEIDRVEYGLRAVLEQCSKIMGSLARVKDLSA